jgi:hypothetical protein
MENLNAAGFNGTRQEERQIVERLKTNVPLFIHIV